MKAFLAAFITVFLAEIGDKTQLATMLLASKSSHKILVFSGAALALILSSALGVIAGSFIGEHVSVKIIRYMSGTIFIILGLAILAGKF